YLPHGIVEESILTLHRSMRHKAMFFKFSKISPHLQYQLTVQRGRRWYKHFVVAKSSWMKYANKYQVPFSKKEA
ncbi:MAG: hypothetical protein ACXWME_08355, partial [Syntrophales bacterium]